MTVSLTAADVSVLQRVLALVTSDAAAAERVLQGIPPGVRAHPDVLFVYSKVLAAQNRFVGARAALERAVAAAPRNGRLWNSLGNLLDDIGENALAVVALQRAVALMPGDAEAWTNLAIAATAAKQFEVAGAAAARAVAVTSGGSAALAARGTLELATQQPDAAAATLQQVVAVNPANAAARHNLAAAFRSLDRSEAALTELDVLMAAGAGAATATIRAHVLAELGRFDEAVAQYRAVLHAAPAHLDAQETLARLLPQIGRGDEALDSYRMALAVTPTAALWHSAIAAARDIGDGATMLTWVGRAERLLGQSPQLGLGRVNALMLTGDRDAATRAALVMATDTPRFPGLQAFLAHLFLAGGDAARAETHALAAAEAAPLDQAPWALLTLIWRLTGDPRETWLADYDRLVMVSELAAPDGWPDLPTFLDDLAEALTRLHVTNTAPAEQSLRGGSQTRGNLFEKRDPVVAAFKTAVQRSSEALLTNLPTDAKHPFLRRNSGRLAFAGSWSVRLRAQGFHVSHIHTSGWLSSACYIAVPPEVAAEGPAGKLQFGVPDAALGIDLSPRRIVRPQAGRLVLFPSYFWHGTVPFDGAESRLTAAFDALPG